MRNPPNRVLFSSLHNYLDVASGAAITTRETLLRSRVEAGEFARFRLFRPDARPAARDPGASRRSRPNRNVRRDPRWRIDSLSSRPLRRLRNRRDRFCSRRGAKGQGNRPRPVQSARRALFEEPRQMSRRVQPKRLLDLRRLLGGGSGVGARAPRRL